MISMRKVLGPRLAAATVVAVSAVGANVVTAPEANAWAVSSTVNVEFNVLKCSGTAGQWGWYRTTDGESGWVHWNDGYQGTFTLHHVPYSGSVATIKWGTPGKQCGIKIDDIRRPAWGTQAYLGWIG